MNVSIVFPLFLQSLLLLLLLSEITNQVGVDDPIYLITYSSYDRKNNNTTNISNVLSE